MVYISALVFSLLLEQVYKPITFKIGNKKKVIISKTFLCIFPFFFLMAFRWNLGHDTLYGFGHYSSAYTHALYDSNLAHYPVAFYILMRSFSKAGIPIFWFYFVISCIYCLSTIRLIKTLKLNLVWSCITFFGVDMFLFSFSAIRQTLSLAFIMFGLSYYFADDKHGKRNCILMFAIASLFHYTSLVYFAIFILDFVDKKTPDNLLSQKKLIKLFIAGIFLSPILYVGCKHLIPYIYHVSESTELKFTQSYFLFYAILVYFSYLYNKKIIEQNSKYNVILLLNIAFFVVSIISPVLYNMDRIFHLFSPLYLICIPTIFDSIRGRNESIIFTLLMIAIFCWFVKGYFIPGTRDYEEFGTYRSVFENWDYYTSLHGS